MNPRLNAMIRHYVRMAMMQDMQDQTDRTLWYRATNDSRLSLFEIKAFQFGVQTLINHKSNT